MAKASIASKKTNSPTANRNVSFNTTGGKSVSIKDGVKTYSDSPLQVKGKDGISISGQSYSRDKGGTGFSNVITSQDLATSGTIKLPPPATTQVPDFTANNAGLTNPEMGITAGPGGTLTVADPAQDKYAGASKIQNDFQAALAQLNAPTGADVQRQLEKETGLKRKQQAVNDYTAQLNTIVANRDANVLRVEGQGRGIPDVIIGGQQSQINKEAAIQALPVQAQLAAAQGNLELAQSHINTWGQILMTDATNQYNRKKDVLTSVRDFAVGLEFKRIDDLEAANERKYQEETALATARTKAMSQALSQPGGQAVVSAIAAAKDEAGIVAALGKYNGDVLGQQIQQEQLNKLRNPAPTGGGGVVVTGDGRELVKVSSKEIQDVNDTAIKAASASKIINNMIASIQNNGSYVMFGSEKGNRESNRTALLLAMKSLEGTGALDQGTIDVLSGTIPNNELLANDAGQIAKLNNLKTILTEKADAFVNSYRGTEAEVDPRTARIYQAPVSSVLSPEEQAEFDTIFSGGTSNSTAAFNPAAFF